MTKADKVILNGNIYCVKPRGKFVEAIAITNGLISALGTNDEIECLITNDTKVFDLEGKTVLPSLLEGHAHGLDGGYKHLYRCNLSEGPTVTLESLLEEIEKYVITHPSQSWIIGGNWPFELQGELHKSFLDKIEMNRPMVFFDFSTHNAWVNSKALEIAGINSETENPDGGEILKDENNDPTGVLLENAVNLIHEHLEEMTDEEAFESVQWTNQYLNSFGFTAIKEASVNEGIVKAYKKLADNNKLTMRVATCFEWKCDFANNTPYEEQEALINNRKKYEHRLINPNFAKIFIDGVPAYKTGSFIEPYVGDSVETHNWKNTILVDVEEIKQDLAYLDKQGITVKMHATGDAAVRLGLDAIELARQENSNSHIYHEIAHNGFIHEEDLERYNQLSAVAEFSPPIWYPSKAQEEKKKILGKKRIQDTFPIKTVLDTNANVVVGSDWPVVPSPNPWITIETLVTRKNPHVTSDEIQNKGERLSLFEAIEVMTINVAKAMYLDHIVGSIEVGKSADLIILNCNIFTKELDELGETFVLETLFEGESVFKK